MTWDVWSYLHLFPQEYYQLLAQFAHDPETDMSKVEFDTFAVTHAVADNGWGNTGIFPHRFCKSSPRTTPPRPPIHWSRR